MTTVVKGHKIEPYANLSLADLRYADLSGAYLSGADLTGADLRYADLSGAYLSGAYLIGANLIGANLIGADLIGADLSGADLSGADLIGANLSGAYLSGADLTGADLRYADLLCTGNMEEIKSLWFEKWGVVYTYDTLQIGCQKHSIEKWRKWDTPAGKVWVDNMDSDATEWACKFMPIVLMSIDTSPAKPTKG